MTAYLTAGIGFVYLGIAVGHAVEGRLGLALAFVAYAIANAGLVLAEKGI